MWFPTMPVPQIQTGTGVSSRVHVQSNVSGDATVETHVVTSVNGVTTTVDKNTVGSVNIVATGGATTGETLPTLTVSPEKIATPAKFFRTPTRRFSQMVRSFLDTIWTQLYRLFLFKKNT